ncbi:glycosyltransferase involved in cell wall biosynthesis [Pantoea agglomerans]|uniref:glycosyltransferase family 2 protein n=1 Tax=Enterobacter agglomerans TaxID=549 RepID=UPI000E20DAF7|nr:glycosyltransferase family 2 protein [Pantoea agglomerans]MBA8863255.1 glycosyltransferase involved in cell wall biosynthesis [Pantoea agglomerans]MBA8890460.1 glycosyltransferase involved in cell wall biosynthesis [Pantoea agglomerans]
MKLIIQMPCFNEAGTLEIALSALPRDVEGFDCVEWLIIDDGSTDETVKVAQRCGVDHIVQHMGNKGLAVAFMTGIENSLKFGADVIVNTDADNQYDARNIPDLVKPILEHRSEMVIGARPINAIEHFSPAKKLLQKIGSWVVRGASKTNIPDAPSGFRAFSKSAAQKLIVFSEYTYTLETIIQAGQKDISVCSVDVGVNEDLRPSRLVKSIPSYIQRSIFTIIRIYVIYRPFRFFLTLGALLLFVGLLISLRYMYFYFFENGEGHIQSLILSAIFIMMGFQTILVSFLADLLSANRKLLEDIRYKTNKILNDDKK